MRRGPTVFCSQITSYTFLIQRKIARRLQHTATSFITKECKHIAHGENVYNKYSWSAFHDNLREMSVIFIFPSVCKIFLSTYLKIEAQMYGLLTHCILFLVKAFRSCLPSSEPMGISLVLLWAGTKSENSTGIKMYTAFILEAIRVSQDGIPEVFCQLFLYLSNQICLRSPLKKNHQAVDCNSWSETIHLIPYPPSGPSIKFTSPQFREKDVMWGSVKCFV